MPKKLVSSFFTVMLILFLSFTSISSSIVFAEDKVSIDKNTSLSDSFAQGDVGEFKIPNRFYHIDSISDKDYESAMKEGFFENLVDKAFGWTDVGSKISDKINYFLNTIVNIAFGFNIFYTKFMLVALEFGFTFDGLDQLIDELEKEISAFTGISGGKLNEGSGLFGNLMKIVVLAVAAYAIYQFLFKRSFIGSIGTILKTVAILALCFMIFSDYGKFLKTANSLSAEMSAFVLNPSSSMSMSEDRETVVLDEMNDTLWSMFVDRPYMYLQYGTHNIDNIGRGRIESLLAMRPGDDRYNYVLESEVVGQGNTLMLNSSVIDKLAFTPFFIFINLIISIPIFLLAIALILLQFWFVVIAAIGPFALLIGLLPTFNGVIKRYLVELMIPLLLKVFFSFFAVMLLVLSNVLYRLEFGARGDIASYIVMGLLEFVLFLTVFMLRGRIMDIFSSGSQMIQNLRGSTDTLTSPMKKAVQGGMVLAGASAGAVVGGPMGAMKGANMGNSVGRVATGEANVQEMVKTGANLAHLNELQKLNKSRSDDSLNQESHKFTDERAEEISSFFKEQGLDDETVDKVVSDLEKNGMSDTTMDEVKENFEKVKEQAESGELNQTFDKAFVGQMKSNRENERLQSHLSSLKGGSAKQASVTAANAQEFFAGDKFKEMSPEMKNQIVQDLERNGLNNVSLNEMESQYHKLQEQHNRGELKQDFAHAFVSGIKDEQNAVNLNKLNDSVLGDSKASPSSTASNVASFFHDKGLTIDDKDMLNSIATNLEQNGLHDVTKDEMEQQYSKLQQLHQEGKLKEDFPTAFANGIVNERKAEAAKLQEQNKENLNRNVFKGYENKVGQVDSETANNMTKVYVEQGMGNYEHVNIPAISKELESKGIYNLSEQEIKHHHKQVQDGLNNGSLQGDYQELFVSGVMQDRNINGSSLGGSPVGGSSLDNSSMNNSILDNSSMEGSNIGNSNIGGSSMNSSSIGSSSMNGSNLDGSSMSGSSLGGNQLDSASIGGSNVGGSPINGQPINAENGQSNAGKNETKETTSSNNKPYYSKPTVNEAKNSYEQAKDLHNMANVDVPLVDGQNQDSKVNNDN